MSIRHHPIYDMGVFSAHTRYDCFLLEIVIVLFMTCLLVVHEDAIFIGVITPLNCLLAGVLPVLLYV